MNRSVQIAETVTLVPIFEAVILTGMFFLFRPVRVERREDYNEGGEAGLQPDGVMDETSVTGTIAPILTVRIRDLNGQGQGVGQVEEDPGHADGGLVAFVNGALPGERVKANLVEQKGHYLVLDLLEILETSSDRQVKDCRYFPDCGGCQLRHLTYEAELRFKERRVNGQLDRQGIRGVDGAFRPILGMEDPLHYRGKSSFPAAPSRLAGDGPAIGHYRRGSHDLVNLEDCQIQSLPALALVNRVRELAHRDGISAYDEQAQEGTLRHLVVRTAFASKDLMLTLVVHDRRADLKIKDWLPDLRQTASATGFKLASVWLNDSTARGNRILSGHFRHLSGSRTITETVRGIQYRLSPDSFFQVNPRQAAVLFEEVIRVAGLRPGYRVLDLYCGAGAISLQLASAMRDAHPPVEVIGVDLVARSIADAKTNARLNKLSGIVFVEADATEWLKVYAKDRDKPPFDVLVVDPPRKGLEEDAIRVIRQSGIPRLVYVSCNPASLARDLERLGSCYRLESVQPVDLFPRTTHVEAVVLMSMVDK